MIAILSSNLNKTVEWFRNNVGIKNIETYYSSSKIFKMKDGSEYIIISSPEEARGWEFTSYHKAPDFETLEDIIKTRIK